MKSKILGLLAVGLLAGPIVASATQYRIDFSGQMSVDQSGVGVFGVAPGSSVAFTGVAFADSALGAITEYPTGTDYISALNRKFVGASTGFAVSALTSFSLTVGNQNFTLADLGDLYVGDFGNQFGLFVYAPLSGASSAPFRAEFVNQVNGNSLGLGDILCSAGNCYVDSTGLANDNATGGLGLLSSTLATVSRVPEPGSLALLGLGLAGLGLSRRRKAA